MTPAELISEGRRLQRDCVFLAAGGSGAPAAVWLRGQHSGTDDGAFEPWLGIDTRFVPGLESAEPCFFTLSTSDDALGGRIERVAALPPGLALYGHRRAVLPPIEAVFAFGSDSVAAWLARNDWDRTERYNPNFPDRAVAEAYERQWAAEHPVFGNHPDVYAVLGGWHFPNADDDWYDLAAERLLALTVKDSEPWVEAWMKPSGELHAIQRMT